MQTKLLPVFPLELVVYPGEEVALHIFEDRYQQLIKDCEEDNITFGIPTYIDGKMQYGTEVTLIEVVKRYPSGASDIKCKGLSAFEMEAFYPTHENKLYAAAEIRYLKNVDDGVARTQERFYILLQEFYGLLDLELKTVPLTSFNSFTYAHKMGLSFVQEYEFLKICSESDRYIFLIDHLNRVIPTVKTLNRTKELIVLNGHFKTFNPLDFKAYEL